jgi:hypothetical protein
MENRDSLRQIQALGLEPPRRRQLERIAGTYVIERGPPAAFSSKIFDERAERVTETIVTPKLHIQPGRRPVDQPCDS